MSLRFTVLASGSSGNASLLQCDDFGVLIDAGLGPRLLAERLHAVGASWQHVHAVVLTHTHSDHWRERCFAWLRRRRIIFHCHVDHAVFFAGCSRAFRSLEGEGLVRQFGSHEEFPLGGSLRCRALPVSHDSGATFGFRFEGPADIFGETESLAYAADLGTWDHDLAHALADVDVLALEFNHDVHLEQSSGRAAFLIARVLSDAGHLSNAQAAGLLSEVLARSQRRRLRHLVQLHLSRDCNRRDLAVTAAQTVLAEWDELATVHTAGQDRPTAPMAVGWNAARPSRRRTTPRRARTYAAAAQRMLPGWDLDEDQC
jgi:phosphoribosyl 1,2-cyclic phosphodiesterase